MGLFSKRFKKEYDQKLEKGELAIWTDTETGVQYLVALDDQNEPSAVTPLLGADGRPCITGEK